MNISSALPVNVKTIMTGEEYFRVQKPIQPIDGINYEEFIKECNDARALAISHGNTVKAVAVFYKNNKIIAYVNSDGAVITKNSTDSTFNQKLFDSGSGTVDSIIERRIELLKDVYGKRGSGMSYTIFDLASAPLESSIARKV